MVPGFDQCRSVHGFRFHVSFLSIQIAPHAKPGLVAVGAPILSTSTSVVEAQSSSLQSSAFWLPSVVQLRKVGAICPFPKSVTDVFQPGHNF